MRTLPLLFVLAAASQVGATDCGQITRDPGFDLWCGDDLCAWKVVRGDAQRTATWHEKDAGVLLIGDDAAISQLTPVNSGDASCIHFELVADVDENVEAYIDIDLEGDGRVERHERIPTSHWKPISFNINIGGEYDGIRFEIGKKGTGHAAFARIDAHTRDVAECNGLPPITSGPRDKGASCALDSDCRSNLCIDIATSPPPPLSGGFGFTRVCAGCTGVADTTSCAATEVCGYNDPTQPILGSYPDCVAKASHALGDHCIADAECEFGACQDGRCSACKIGDPCTHGTCGATWGPAVCAPNAHANLSGEPCAADADCASNQCNGAVRKECADHRPCGSNFNCPVDDGLMPGLCRTVGIEGGRCQ
jgi:hypothetical protein